MKKNFALSLAANILRVILGFVFFWQVSQALGVEGLGEYLYVIVAIGYFATLIDYGFNLFILNTASRFTVLARPLFLRVVLSKLIVTMFSIIIIAIIYNLAFSKQGLLVTTLFFVGLVMLSFSGLLLNFFKSLGRFDYEFSSTLLSSFLPVFLLFIFGDDVTILEAGWIVLTVRTVVLVHQLVLFLNSTRGQPWFEIDYPVNNMAMRAINDLRKNIRYAVFSVLGALFLSVDLVIMRFTLGPEEVSIYGTAMRVVLAAILFFEVLNGTFVPRLARIHESGNIEGFRREVFRFSSTMIGCAIVFSVGMVMVGPSAIIWAFGPDFADSGEVVRVLAFVFVLRVMEMTTGPILTVYGLQEFRARAIIIVLPLHIAINWVLQLQVGIWGAVYSLGFSFLLLLLFNSAYLLRARRDAP